MYLFAFYYFIRGYNCPWPIQTCSRKVHWCPSPGSWLFLLVQGTYRDRILENSKRFYIPGVRELGCTWAGR